MIEEHYARNSMNKFGFPDYNASEYTSQDIRYIVYCCNKIDFRPETQHVQIEYHDVVATLLTSQ